MLQKKKGLLALAALIIMALIVTAGPALAEGEDTYQRFENFVNTFPLFGWPSLEEQFLNDPFLFEQEALKPENFGNILTHDQIANFQELYKTVSHAAAFDYIHGILVTESMEVAATTPVSAPNRAAEAAMRQVLLPEVVTKMNREAQKAADTRVIGGALRYQWVSDEFGNEGKIPGATVGMAWDLEDFTVGFLIPYDHMDFDLFNANRVGTILFGKYNIPLDGELEAGVTVTGDYLYLDIEDLNSTNYFGAGVGFSVRHHGEILVPGAAAFYQYTSDDSDSDYDQQHIVKLAANLGVLVGERAVLNFYGMYTNDLSSNLPTYVPNYFYDLGIEFGYSVTEALGFNVGYKRVLGISDYDSDTVYLGSMWQF